jgi:hypothetical protein
MENSYTILLDDKTWLAEKILELKEIRNFDKKALIIKFDSESNKRYPVAFWVLDYIVEICFQGGIKYLTLDNIEFFSAPSDTKFLKLDYTKKIYLIRLTIINCNCYGISEFLTQYKELNIRHIEIISELGISTMFKIVSKNYYLLSLTTININSKERIELPISGIQLPLKGSNKIKDREIVLKINKGFRSKFSMARKVLENIEVFDDYINKLKSSDLEHAILINTVLARNNIIYNNCQKLCISLLVLWRRKNNALQILPKDLIKFLTEIIWETRFDPLTWNTSLIP